MPGAVGIGGGICRMVYKIRIAENSFERCLQMLEINPGNFESEVKKSKTPVLVDFWASWCGPCRMLGPVFEKVSANYTGKVKFAKINVDENQELAGEYGVMGIPTMVLFENGKEKARISGALPEDSLKAWIEDNLE